MASGNSGDTLGVHRQAVISAAELIDFSADCIIVQDDEFDLNATVYKKVELPEVRNTLKRAHGIRVFWSNEARARYRQEYAKVPQAPSPNAALMNFLKEDCDLSLEKADRSVMEHLNFCYEYGINHMKNHSAVPLLLHSAMGGWTDDFPLPLDKVSKLKALVTPEEFAQIQAFPSILRLLHDFTLSDTLFYRFADLARLRSLSCQRVLDNTPLEISADQLWVALNYQLIHALDFMPLVDWSDKVADAHFQQVRLLYGLLAKTGKLYLKLNLDVGCYRPDGGKFTLKEAVASCTVDDMQSARNSLRGMNRYFAEKTNFPLEMKLNFQTPTE